MGALLSAAVFSLVGGLTPATRSNVAMQAAVAVLVPVLVAAATPLRFGAIPMVLGALTMVSALGASTGADLPDVVLTALIAAAATRLAGAVGRGLGRRLGGRRAPVEAADMAAADPQVAGTPSPPLPAPPDATAPQLVDSGGGP
jgi:hypothetical protein